MILRDTWPTRLTQKEGSNTSSNKNSLHALTMQGVSVSAAWISPGSGEPGLALAKSL